MSQGQAFLNETVSAFVVLFLAYGVGLDPRQALLFGPRLGPFLVSVAVGVVSFASSGSIPGYAGAQVNPARCFAYGIVRRDLSSKLSHGSCTLLLHARSDFLQRPVDLVVWPSGSSYPAGYSLQHNSASIWSQR